MNKYDIAVIGGGFAGVAAAISAAVHLLEYKKNAVGQVSTAFFVNIDLQL